jgi:hypothetical protein
VGNHRFSIAHLAKEHSCAAQIRNTESQARWLPSSQLPGRILRLTLPAEQAAASTILPRRLRLLYCHRLDDPDQYALHAGFPEQLLANILGHRFQEAMVVSIHDTL